MASISTRKRHRFLLAAGALPVAIFALTRGPAAVRRRARRDHRERWALWHHFYSVDWGDTTTNNYGFAPAEGSDPQRFQHQLYRELLKLLGGKMPAARPLRLLEVSCGRGGGLQAFLRAAPDRFDSTALDVAASAIAFCRRHHGEHDRLRFVEGSALDLPFPDGSFDVVLNVEASNDYGDRARFFEEAARVLGPDGVFLYAESLKRDRIEQVRSELAGAGFVALFRDITQNVVEACRLDSDRRRSVLRRRPPLLIRMLLAKRLANYAAIEGTRKFRAFAEGRRTYVMTAATKG
jgi:ubiquinone/menaquinone biosynthesis C-methylase UbiE